MRAVPIALALLLLILAVYLVPSRFAAASESLADDIAPPSENALADETPSEAEANPAAVPFTQSPPEQEIESPFAKPISDVESPSDTEPDPPPASEESPEILESDTDDDIAHPSENALADETPSEAEANPAAVPFTESPFAKPISDVQSPSDTEPDPPPASEQSAELDTAPPQPAEGIAPEILESDPADAPSADPATEPLAGEENRFELSPFFTSSESGSVSEFGVRPFFYWLRDEERDSEELDVLYPLATYDRREDARSYQFLFYMLSYYSNLTPSGFQESKFTLFPLVFSKRAEEADKSYFALFPIYGRLKERFARDEINFYLFPLYLETRSGDAVNYSFLWPLFGYYTGGGQEGVRLWPIYGYRKKEGALDEKFALWPIFISKKTVSFGEETASFSVFPLYLTKESRNKTQTTYLWPFINHQVDRKKGTERWDLPWPFVNFTRGAKTETRVFPFYGSEVDGGDEDGFYLWPIYRYSKLNLEDNLRTRKNILLFLYSDIEEEPLIEGGRARRRIDLWPLFTYNRDRDGNRSFHLISPIEPFIADSRGIERNYAPFWRLYQWRKSPDGASSSSALWNAYRMEKNEGGRRIELKPLLPIFSYNQSEGQGSAYDIFGGLFGYKSTPEGRAVKLFFYDVNISVNDTSGVRRLNGDE
ncbi:MAG: hypothetical protein ACT4NX_01650 [Deltaproteobacteria bacterium]